MTTEQKQPSSQATDPAQATAVPQTDAELIDALRRESAELRDKNLRLLADVRNTQQRLQRDKEQALRYAEADFARDLLLVLDDLQRTQSSVASGADAQAIADGVRIAGEHFIKILKSRGVEPIPAAGQPFDPNVHEALVQQPSATVPSGTVLEEVAAGYKMHDRVLRPARVVVSKGDAEN